MHKSELLLKGLREIILKHLPQLEGKLVAVDVMGSVARLNPNPNDLNISFWVRSEYVNDGAVKALVGDVETMCTFYNVRFEGDVISVERICELINMLVERPEELPGKVHSLYEVTALVHAVKQFDYRSGCVLYAIFLQQGYLDIPFHNMFVYGGEIVVKLVSKIVKNVRTLRSKVCQLLLGIMFGDLTL